MTTHPKADCISFTGGDTGIKISQKAGMVPLQMELGGKDVCIVCADADLDLAAKSIISGGLSYQVWFCCCMCLEVTVRAGFLMEGDRRCERVTSSGFLAICRAL